MPATLPSLTITWADVTLVGGDGFQQWNVRRRVSGTTSWTRLAVIVTRGTRSYIDYTPASGVLYDYGVTVTVSRAGTLVESPVGTISTSIVFTSAFLHDVRNPSTYVEVKSVGLTVDDVQSQSQIQTWGTDAPTIYIGSAQPQTFDVQGVPADWLDFSTWRAIEAAYTNQRLLGSVFCYRNYWAPDRRFVAITKLQRVDSLGYWEYRATLAQCKFNEAV